VARAGHAKLTHAGWGDGPFPTELTDEIGQLLGDRARVRHQHRPDRGAAAVDAIMVRQAVKLNGIDGIALTKLDVLDGLRRSTSASAYELDGKRIERFPFTMARRPSSSRCGDLRGLGRKHPRRALVRPTAGDLHQYVRRVEELVGLPQWRCSAPAPSARTRSYDGSVPR